MNIKKILSASSSNKTEEFYDKLMLGSEKRGIFGRDARFDALRIASTPSVSRFYTDLVRPYIASSDKVLDFGCGPGSFLVPIAPYCAQIVGLDISHSFVTECQRTIEALNITNASSIYIQPDEIPFRDSTFDALILVDVIHHLEQPEQSLQEAMRVLKPGGRVFILEPNKLNPILALIHILDSNERGLLRFGSPKKYRVLLQDFMNIDSIEFNGIVIGPQSKIFYFVSSILNFRFIKPILGWLNPKIYISGLKRC